MYMAIQLTTSEEFAPMELKPAHQFHVIVVNCWQLRLPKPSLSYLFLFNLYLLYNSLLILYSNLFICQYATEKYLEQW